MLVGGGGGAEPEGEPDGEPVGGGGGGEPEGAEWL